MGTWDLDFIQRPDGVTGLQRRTGSYVTEFKSNIQERIVKEHGFEVGDAVPQTEHGTHTEGSGKIFVTAIGDSDPVDRPTGGGQAAIPLDDNDRGRLLVREERELAYYKDSADGWVRLELTEVGAINLWPGSAMPTNWFLCNGALLQRDDYTTLFGIIGTLYGTESATDFRIPDLQGLIPMGKGTQDVDTRTKGYTDALGTVKEDRIQTFDGSVGMHQVYSEANIVNVANGIFKLDTAPGGPEGKRLDRAGVGTEPNYGFEIDLANPTEPIRNGDFSHPSVMLMNYIIKVL